MKKLNKTIIASLVAVVALSAFSGLAISKGNSDKNNNKPENTNQFEKQWYLSNTISVYDGFTEDTYTGFNAAVLGKLAESSDGYDKHDISSFVSLAKSKAAVFFVHDNWGNHSGEYHSDYHDSNGQSDSWVMTVVSTVEGGEVTLNWDGLYALTSTEDDNGIISYTEKYELDSRTLDKLQLIDLETLEVIEAVSAGELNSYTFYMEDDEEGIRQFRWVLGPINASYFAPASGAMRYIKQQQRELEREQRDRDAEFDLPADDKFGSPPRSR